MSATKLKPTEYLKFNGKIIRHDGSLYKITSTRLGKSILVDCDVILGENKGTSINLLTSRSKLANNLREMLGMNLVT
jgi:hypothetical protein